MFWKNVSLLFFVFIMADLPLDLLIIIRKHIHGHLTSFRSACSNWRSAVPIPTTLPHYDVSYNNQSDVITFTKDNKYGRRSMSIPLSFNKNSLISFFKSSNGWLVFKAHKTEVLHLFNPLSARRLIFPCMSLKLFRQVLKASVHDRCMLSVTEAVVSSNTAGGVAVAAIVQLDNGSEHIGETRLAFCRYGYDKSWSLLMKGIEGITDIIVASDGRIFALNKDCELYIINEWHPTIILKRFKVVLPYLEKDHTDERQFNMFYSMQEIGAYLEIYWHNSRRSCGKYITFKLDMSKLSQSNNSVNVMCEDEWGYKWHCRFCCSQFFTPVFKPSIEFEE